MAINKNIGGMAVGSSQYYLEVSCSFCFLSSETQQNLVVGLWASGRDHVMYTGALGLTSETIFKFLKIILKAYSTETIF